MSLRKAVSRALVVRGYERDGRTHLKAVGDGVHVYVDTGPVGRQTDIAPYVGLRHDAVSDLVSDLLELPRDRFVGTVGANVGYVLGRGYAAWYDPGDADAVLAAIDQAEITLLDYVPLHRLPDAWSLTDGTLAPGYYYKIAATWLLLEEAENASHWLRVAKDNECRFEGSLCDQYKRVERNARRLFPTLLK